AASADDAYAFRGPAHPERDSRLVRAEIADVDALEPGRERGLDDDALPREVGLEAEDRAEAEEHHAGGPGLRDARDEVIGGPRREAEIAREAAEELRQLRVREPPAGLHERAHDLGRLLAEPVAGEAVRDERVVVRPDRAVVVAHRVVRRIPARERADAPAGVHVRRHEAMHHARGTLPRGDPAPERVSGVARDGLHLPLPPLERLPV